MDNKGLRQSVIDELGFEPSVKAENIAVTTANGIVTLSGHVRSYAEKIAAEKATLRVQGVKAVVQALEVHSNPNDLTPDEQLAVRVANVIAWNSLIPKTVRATVQKGWITLTGDVDWHYERQAAENAVNRMAAVVGVTNGIHIKLHANTSDVKKSIVDALQRSAEVEASAIKVRVNDDKVTLEGTVHNYAERAAVERAAWSVAGVRAVQDLLIVA